MRKDYGGVFGIAFALALVIITVAMGAAAIVNKFKAIEQQQQSQSWDQGNLKQNDHGCPTAIFIAPGGNLQQCQVARQLVSRFAPPVPQVAPPEFTTIEAAAIFGLMQIASKSTAEYYEWGGVLVKLGNGKYAALEPNTSYAGDHVEIHRGDDFGLNATAVGDYHTHPCLPGHDVEYFSPPDLALPLFYRMTAFMGDFCTGNVHEFKVGDKADVEHPVADVGQELYMTKGRIIGRFTTPRALAVAG